MQVCSMRGGSGGAYLPAFIAGTNIDRMAQIAGLPLATASLVPDPLP